MYKHMINEFAEIDKDVFNNFIIGKGFKRTGENENIIVYRNSVNAELLFPKQSIDDIEYIIDRNINILASTLSCEPEKLLKIILNRIDDEFKFQIIHDDVSNGTIPLDDGMKLIEGGKELLTSSANSLISPKPYYLGKNNQTIIEYLDKIRLGQTEIGSYIVNIFVDIKDHEKQELFDENYFGRKVSRRVLSNLQELNSTVKDYKKNNKIEIFDEAVANGISANLCKSILDLGGEINERDVHIAVKIQNILEIEDFEEFVEIRKEDLRIIHKGYEHLMNTEKINDFELSGYVTKLNRDENHYNGEISIATYINEKQRKVKAVLTSEQYDIAILAHKEQEMIFIRGDLIMETRRAEIVSIQDVYIESDD